MTSSAIFSSEAQPLRALYTFRGGWEYKSPPAMLNHAWRHLHDSWKHSGKRKGLSRSFSGGVYWQKLTDQLLAVQHRLPTVFMCNFIEEDIVFFRQSNVFQNWDHVFPAVCLIYQQRYRYIGSSDPAFIVEITEEHRNVPFFNEVNPVEPDAFYADTLHPERIHHYINRLFVTIFNFEKPVDFSDEMDGW
jgi:hypothetical protein